jgi:DNA (cytosine-5)-methyltransferase 1
MGFKDSFSIPVSDTQAYRQFGNSVAIPVFSEVARVMQPHIFSLANRFKAYQSPLRLTGTE